MCDTRLLAAELSVVTEELGVGELAGIGQSYQFSLALLLSVGNLSHLSLHISGTDPASEQSSIHLCSPTITNMQADQVVNIT